MNDNNSNKMFKLLVLCTVWIGLTNGYSRFRYQIPNGFEVKHPCPGGGVWNAVGHMAPEYTPRKNAFGQVRFVVLNRKKMG